MVFGDVPSVLLGGLSGAALLADTWEWDGALDHSPTSDRRRVPHTPPRSTASASGSSSSPAKASQAPCSTTPWRGTATGRRFRMSTTGAIRPRACVRHSPRRAVFGGSARPARSSETLGMGRRGSDGGRRRRPFRPRRARVRRGPFRHEPVLFGGADSGGALLGDTWARREASWVQAQNAGPPPTTQAALAGRLRDDSLGSAPGARHWRRRERHGLGTAKTGHSVRTSARPPAPATRSRSIRIVRVSSFSAASARTLRRSGTPGSSSSQLLIPASRPDRRTSLRSRCLNPSASVSSSRSRRTSLSP